MTRIHVPLICKEDLSYNIYLESGIYQHIPRILSENHSQLKDRKVCIVSDSNLRDLYAKKLLDAFQEDHWNAFLFSFPAGEKYKTVQTKIELENFLFQKNFARDSLLIALGGGVVGDLVGFTASTLNRGIPYVQVPTTLIAQVDSSLGGKTGVDVPKYGKNLIGTFYQPLAVFTDPLFLLTLSDSHYYAGMAEIIKHAVIQDSQMFQLLLDQKSAIQCRDKNLLEKLIAMNCEIKTKVVQQDEKELGMRQILNFGHTIGHALESEMDYEILHGEAVAIGMVIEAFLSSELKYLPKEYAKRIESCIALYHLPIRIPAFVSLDGLLAKTRLDKKSQSSQARYALPTGIGQMLLWNGNYSIPVENELLKRVLVLHQENPSGTTSKEERS